MESLQELKAICQTTAKKDVSNVYMRYVSRSLSIFLTRALIPTAVTPDQVSFVMILTGLLSAVFFLCPDKIVFFLGTLVLQFWYILDCVDGELARYRDYVKRKEITKEKSDLPITGGYWDYLNHYIVHGSTALGLGYGYFAKTGSHFWLFCGFVMSLAQTMLLAVHDTKSRAFVGKLTKMGKTHDVIVKTVGAGAPEQPKQHSLPKRIFMIVHYSGTFPTVMNVITLAALLSLFGKGDFRALLLLYYAAASTVVFLGLAAKNLKDRGVDRDFDALFDFRPKV
ncbi:MAG TPA: hypothetical protein VL688_12085 [Verrucomicrobiae bacterium]|nr:hypothetical protein [Verrucomicrobiae bacterium]